MVQKIMTYESMVKMASSPRVMDKTPSSQPDDTHAQQSIILPFVTGPPYFSSTESDSPLITRPLPMGVANGPRPLEESNLPMTPRS